MAVFKEAFERGFAQGLEVARGYGPVKGGGEYQLAEKGKGR